jgi:hypothetical protein
LGKEVASRWYPSPRRTAAAGSEPSPHQTGCGRGWAGAPPPEACVPGWNSWTALHHFCSKVMKVISQRGLKKTTHDDELSQERCHSEVGSARHHFASKSWIYNQMSDKRMWSVAKKPGTQLYSTQTGRRARTPSLIGIIR